MTFIPAAGVTVNSATSLSFTTPANAAGTVGVTVTTPSGTSGAVAGGFTYQAAAAPPIAGPVAAQVAYGSADNAIPGVFDFTEVLLNGSRDGKFTFIEPMMTLDWLQERPTLQEPVKQPASYQRTGYYPTTYTVRFDGAAQEYVIALGGMTMRSAS